MNIDLIIIIAVAVLLILVVARIIVQRRRSKVVPENVREAGSVPPPIASMGKKPVVAKPPEKKEDSITENISEEMMSDLLSGNEKETADLDAQLEAELEAADREDAERNDGPLPSLRDKFGDFDDSNAEKPEKPVKKYTNVGYIELVNNPVPYINNKEVAPPQRITAIKEAGFRRLKEAVPALIECLYDPEASISLVATESLGAIGDERAIEPLMEVANRHDQEVAKAAEEFMGGELMVVGAQPDFDSQNGNNGEGPVDYKAMVVFKVDQLPLEYFQPDGTPIPRTELVLKGLKDDNEQLRQMAAKAAIGLESEEVVEPLTEALNNPLESESVRAMAAEALGGMGNDESVTALIDALKDDNVAVRYAAAAALSGNVESRVVEALILATKDEDKYVRASAAYALGTTRAGYALIPLIKCAEDENEVVRFSAVNSIAAYDFEDVYKRLMIKNKDEAFESKNRILAKIEILGKFKDDRAIKHLKEYLQDSDADIVFKATNALMGHEDPSMLEELIAASKKLDKELMNLAKENIAPEVFSDITKYNIDFGESAPVSAAPKVAQDSSSEAAKEGLHSEAQIQSQPITEPELKLPEPVEDDMFAAPQLEFEADPFFSQPKTEPEMINGNIPPSKMINGNIPPSRQKAAAAAAANANANAAQSGNASDITMASGNSAVDKAAAAVRARNQAKKEDQKREETVLNLNPSDYGQENQASTPIPGYQSADEYGRTGYPAPKNTGFANENLDAETTINVLEPVDSNFPEIDYENFDKDSIGLGDITGLPSHFEKLRKNLMNQSPNVRGSAANALGGYNNSPEAITLLRAALKDNNDLVRAAVINSLGKISTSESLEIILTCEKDSSSEVRYAVVKALAGIPDYTAGECLRRLAAADPDIDIKRNARLALEKHS